MSIKSGFEISWESHLKPNFTIMVFFCFRRNAIADILFNCVSHFVVFLIRKKYLMNVFSVGYATESIRNAKLQQPISLFLHFNPYHV